MTITPTRNPAVRRTWEITGTVDVEESATTRGRWGHPSPRRRPLAGITIEVAGSPDERSRWTEWGETTTDVDGRFRLRVQRPAWPHRFRVVARLANEQLVVGAPAADGSVRVDDLRVDDLRLVDSTGPLVGPLVDLGAFSFRVGAAGALGDTDAIRWTATWYVVRTAMDFLTGLAAELGFRQRIAVVYPALVVGGASCANGATRTACIHRGPVQDDWSADAVLHEVMHLWVHQHSDGEARWLRATCADDGLDGLERQPAVAFDEGFAEFAKNELITALWGRTRPEPLTRGALAARDLHSLDAVERDPAAVSQALHLLTTRCLRDLTGEACRAAPVRDRGAATPQPRRELEEEPQTGCGCSCPAITFADVLRVFLAGQSLARPAAWPLGAPNLGLVEFCERASDILWQVDPDGWARYRAQLDIAATKVASRHDDHRPTAEEG